VIALIGNFHSATRLALGQWRTDCPLTVTAMAGANARMPRYTKVYVAWLLEGFGMHLGIAAMNHRSGDQSSGQGFA
jgi:hypothetical protein